MRLTDLESTGEAPDLGVHREAPWSHWGHHQWPDSAGWLGDLRRGFAVGSQGAGDRPMENITMLLIGEASINGPSIPWLWLC